MKTLSQCIVCSAIKPLDDMYKANHSYNDKCKRCVHIEKQLREGVKIINLIEEIKETINDTITPTNKLIEIRRLINARA